MSGISACFQALSGKKALIPFIVAGDPSPALTVSLMEGLVDGGADIIELGVPFSDPMADGPVIQRASERALRHQVSLKDVLAMVARFRQHNQHTPVVLMGYLNPIVRFGYALFARAAYEAGVDGVLTVDCPPEESAPLTRVLVENAIDPIFLLSPTTSLARVATITQSARGYVYYVALNGVTGASCLDVDEVRDKLAGLRQLIDIPIGVGFGIRDTTMAKALSGIADVDAIVVGSRLVQEIESAPAKTAKARLTHLVAELKAAIQA